MNETQLGNSMRALPRAMASPAFKSRVLHAVHDEERRPAPFVFRLAAAFAMAACLVAIVQVAMMQYERRETIEAMRVEQQQMKAELEAVKKSVNEPVPMVVLENDRGARVVMDDSAIQPASLRTFD